MTRIGLGFRAGRGGSVVVGVAVDGGEPLVVLSTFLATAAEGRKRQGRMAANGLNAIVRALQKSRCKPVVAALLVNRAGWITDLLEYSLFAPEHPPVAEGLAVRDALRFALDRNGIKVVEMDEKSLQEVASRALRLSIADIDIRLKGLGATAGKPWRKEQKLACLSAWLAVRVRHDRRRLVTA